MDECTREVQYLRHLLHDLGEPEGDTSVPIYNDNCGAIQWSETGSLTQKRLRHLNIRTLAVLEARNEGEVQLYHIPGKLNPGDLCTKEDRDKTQFYQLRSMTMCDCGHGGCQEVARKSSTGLSESAVT